MKSKFSRRQFGKTVAATVGGAVLAGSAGAQTEKKSAVPTSDEDVRLKLIEKSRGKELSSEQRKAVLETIHNNDKQAAESRSKFQVPDTTEPAIVFTPTPLSRQRYSK